MVDIQTKRVYESAVPEDGFRVLVDRLWPRGKTKEQVQADLWLKEIAPSNELRKWFHHEQSNWDDFKQRYLMELEGKTAAVERLLNEAAKGRVTLLYSAKDDVNNQAVVLKEYLLSHTKNESR